MVLVNVSRPHTKLSVFPDISLLNGALNTTVLNAQLPVLKSAPTFCVFLLETLLHLG